MFFENKGIIINGEKQDIRTLNEGDDITISYDNELDPNIVLIHTSEKVYEGNIVLMEELIDHDYRVVV